MPDVAHNPEPIVRAPSPCGCRQQFFTEVSRPVSLDDILAVACRCCGAEQGQPCAGGGTHLRSGKRWGDVCEPRMLRIITGQWPADTVRPDEHGEQGALFG